jgi:hypothetical protein
MTVEQLRGMKENGRYVKLPLLQQVSHTSRHHAHVLCSSQPATYRTLQNLCDGS